MKKNQIRLLIWLRWLQQRKGFIARILICWVFSLFILKFDDNGNYDIRFKLRGEQKISGEIVLITLSASDFSALYDFKTSSLISRNELSDISDSFYWEKDLWLNLLKKILDANPKKIGITLYFGNNIAKPNLSYNERQILQNPKIIWATNSSEPEKLSLPISTLPNRSNISHIEHLRDDDGITRRLMYDENSIEPLSRKISDKKKFSTTEPHIINYPGLKVFKELRLSDALSDKLPADFFKDKIILIGSEKSDGSQVQTPMGAMSKHNFWATTAENSLNNSFIKKLPFVFYALFLLLLTFVAVSIILAYPQNVALLFLIWLATLTAAFSAWIFDFFYIWIPIISPISLLILIWILFTAYQASKIEEANQKLKQQQQYLAELEQLKNNFVSLISHDLKTPIAKIQAALNRMLTTPNQNPENASDLNNIKEYSEELNRYIQSILKVLRVESRDFKIIKETVDVNELILLAVKKLQPLASSKTQAIETNLEPLFLIELDATLITEVFLNIIENAIKYTPANGLIKVRSYETDKDVCIEISDSGEGISEEDQKIIWNKFSRGKSQDYKTKGSGLGLYLVKYFIELHGGEITLQSRVNHGTTFTIKLPI